MKRRLASAGLGVVVLLSLVMLACGGGDDDGGDSNAPEATATPSLNGNAEVALKAFSQQQLQKELIPDCTKADSSADADKLCATYRGDREGQVAFTIAPVNNQQRPVAWVFLRVQGIEVAVANSIAITGDNSGAPGIPWPLRAGADVVITAQPDACLNVREGPGTGQRAVDCVNNGTLIKLAAGPVPADNLNWWQIQGRAGWVAGEFLRYPDAAQ